MRIIMVFLFFLVVAISAKSFATGIGISTHPFTPDENIVNANFTGNFSSGSGVGAQIRYFRRLTQNINIDGGIGVSGGERESRFFVGSDFMFFPDYGNQPRFSVKALYENEDVFGNTVNAIGIAPTLSKGFVVYGNEVFPFLAVPIQLGLDDDTNTYETITSVSTGFTIPTPIRGFEDLVTNFEFNWDINNSYTATALGVSLPLK